MAQRHASSFRHLGRETTKASQRRNSSRISANAAALDGDIINTQAQIAGGIFTDTDGPTITFDMAFYNIHQVTLGGNRTLSVANVNYTTNQRFRIKLIQDGTGSRLVTWFSGIKWANGVVPILTTAAGKADWFGFICTGLGTYDGFAIGTNV